MKRRIFTFIITLVASLSFALCLGACDNIVENETIYGHWETEKFIMGPSSYPFESSFNITVSDDGTVTAGDVFGSDYANGTGTWTEENGVYDLVITYELSDGLSTERYTGTINKKRLTLKHSVMPYTYTMVKK